MGSPYAEHFALWKERGAGKYAYRDFVLFHSLHKEQLTQNFLTVEQGKHCDEQYRPGLRMGGEVIQ